MSRRHLTYCTNIHPGETWAEVRDNLARYIVPVRERCSPGEPDVLAALLPEDVRVAHLVRVQAATGRRIALAIEPEPCCFLETVAQTVDFFTRHLFRLESVAALVREAGLTPLAAEGGHFEVETYTWDLLPETRDW